MKPNKIRLFLPVIIYLFFLSCQDKDPRIDIIKERQLVEETINNSIGWAKNKDLALLYRTISNDSAFLEVRPGPGIVEGFEEFSKSEDFWMHPDFKAIRYEIRDLKISISGSGDAAWWYCTLDDINEWKGEPANWENTRWTGVMEKRKGSWVIVQQHFSFADTEE
mgnify:CR=1 FL=1